MPKNATKSNVSHQNKWYRVCSSPQLWGSPTSKTYGQNLSFGQFPIYSSYIWPLEEYIGNFHVPPLNKIVTLTMPSLLSLTPPPPLFYLTSIPAPVWSGRSLPRSSYFFCPSLYPGVHGYCEGEVSNLYQFPVLFGTTRSHAFFRTTYGACFHDIPQQTVPNFISLRFFSSPTHPHSNPTNLVCIVCIVYNVYVSPFFMYYIISVLYI